MAATATKTMWYHSNVNGTAPNIVRGLVAASQGIMIPGAPLYLSASGTWKLCDTTDGSDAWHGFFIGLQNKSSTWPITAELSANTGILVARIREDDRFCVYCENNGTDSAVAQANVGNDYGLVVSSTSGEVGYVSLDLNSTTNTGVVIEDIMSTVEPSKFSTSDNPGVALVRFETAILEAQKA
jgi:hypothetical protein